MHAPQKQSARALATEALDHLDRKHGLSTRCGGRKHTVAARARLESLALHEEITTHADPDALHHAADAIGVALLAVERSHQEHLDARASENNLVRARVLLSEALLLVECAAHVNYHADRIQAARESAVDPVDPKDQVPSGRVLLALDRATERNDES